MNSRKSFIEKLEADFESLQMSLWKFLSEIEVESVNNKTDGCVIAGRPSFRWRELTLSQEKVQVDLSRLYESFINNLDGLVSYTPVKEVKKRYEKIKKVFESWLYLQKNFALSGSAEENKKSFLNNINKMKNILELYKNEEKSFIIVPDTNALFIEPDPAKYKDIVKIDNFVFLLLPTVISELDKKAQDDKKEIGKKAKGLIKRIKGWRAQGEITRGITIDKTITLKAEIENKSFDNMPDFLEESHNDDKIIMNVLNIQRRFPSSIVILVTKDINMQNKAECTMVDCVDIEFIKEHS